MGLQRPGRSKKSAISAQEIMAIILLLAVDNMSGVFGCVLFLHHVTLQPVHLHAAHESAHVSSALALFRKRHCGSDAGGEPSPCRCHACILPGPTWLTRPSPSGHPSPHASPASNASLCSCGCRVPGSTWSGQHAAFGGKGSNMVPAPNGSKATIKIKGCKIVTKKTSRAPGLFLPLLSFVLKFCQFLFLQPP